MNEKSQDSKKNERTDSDHTRSYPPRFAVVKKESVKLYDPDSYTTRKRIIGVQKTFEMGQYLSPKPLRPYQGDLLLLRKTENNNGPRTYGESRPDPFSFTDR